MKVTKENIDNVFKSRQVSVETMQLKGYELIKEYFVDNSGFGSTDEPALTLDKFTTELEALLNQYGQVHTTLTGVGQFQVFVGVFKRAGNKTTKRIATNVLEREENNKTIIRLYDTDIVTLSPFKIILNSGGFQTHTTKEWINKYLPQGLRLYQKDFGWYIEDSRDTIPSKVIMFEDNMEISL